MTTTTHNTTRHNTTRHKDVSLYTLGHHLNIAREQYIEHAKVMEQAGEGYLPLRDEFLRMAEECAVLCDSFQWGEKVRVRVVGDRLYVDWKKECED